MQNVGEFLEKLVMEDAIKLAKESIRKSLSVTGDKQSTYIDYVVIDGRSSAVSFPTPDEVVEYFKTENIGTFFRGDNKDRLTYYKFMFCMEKMLLPKVTPICIKILIEDLYRELKAQTMREVLYEPDEDPA